MPGFFNSKLMTFVLILLIIFLAHSVLNVKNQRDIVAKEIKSLKDTVANLQKINDSLNQSSSYFKSDAFLEKQARLQLNYKLPGEQVAFVYQDATAVKVSSSEPFNDILKTLPNYKKWFYYLLGY